MNGLVSNEQKQKTGTVGVTLTKSQAKDSLISVALAVADAGYVYAINIGDLVLKEACSLNKSILRQAKDVDVIAICQNVYDAVNPIVGSLATYGASVATLSSLQNAIGVFSNAGGETANARAIVKVATGGIAA